jgi:hypothetical protein
MLVVRESMKIDDTSTEESTTPCEKIPSGRVGFEVVERFKRLLTS